MSRNFESHLTYSSVGVGGSDLAVGVALKRSVNCLGHQNGAGNGQVVLAGDQRSSTEVGRSTNALKDRSEAQETLGVGVGERVSASLDGFHASLLEGTGEELDVLLLIVGDVLKVVVVVATVACRAISIMRSPWGWGRDSHIPAFSKSSAENFSRTPL